MSKTLEDICFELANFVPKISEENARLVAKALADNSRGPSDAYAAQVQHSSDLSEYIIKIQGREVARVTKV